MQQEFSKQAAKNQIYTSAEAVQDKKRIAEVQAALNKSYNSKLGVVSTKALNQNLGLTTAKAQQLYQTFSKVGSVGQQAFASLIARTNTFQVSAKNVSTTWEKLQTTMANTARWGITSAIFQGITSSIMDAVSYVKELDESLTQITMVSGESRDNMKDFAAYANKAAASLGSSTTDYTNAVKVFVQEGFSLNESKEQATQATILGNVSEQDTSTTADQITAYRNAFGLSIEDMNSSLDKLANTANSTAADVGELMTAAQKAASTAAAVGASEDSFLASIATIQSVTRESAENIGNGLKSIYTRFADVSMGETTDDDVNLGQYAQALKSAGVNITDDSGNLKSMDTILSELQEVWATLDNTKKVAVGEKVAGRYQYNRFATLMNNQEYYDKAYAATQNADGAMEQMQSDYMEGITGKTQKMMTNIETLFTQIYNSGIVEAVVGGITDLSDVLSNLFDNINGGLPVITALSALFLKIGGKQLASGIVDRVQNLQSSLSNKHEAEAQRGQAIDMLKNIGGNSHDAASNPEISEAVEEYARTMVNAKGMGDEFQQTQGERLSKRLSLAVTKQSANTEADEIMRKYRGAAEESGILEDLENDKSLQAYDKAKNALNEFTSNLRKATNTIDSLGKKDKKELTPDEKIELKNAKELVTKTEKYNPVEEFNKLQEDVAITRNAAFDTISQRTKDYKVVDTSNSNVSDLRQAIQNINNDMANLKESFPGVSDNNIIKKASKVTSREVAKAKNISDYYDKEETSARASREDAEEKLREAERESGSTSKQTQTAREEFAKRTATAVKAVDDYNKALTESTELERQYALKQDFQKTLQTTKDLLTEDSGAARVFRNSLSEIDGIDLDSLEEDIDSVINSLKSGGTSSDEMLEKLRQIVTVIAQVESNLPEVETNIHDLEAQAQQAVGNANQTRLDTDPELDRQRQDQDRDSNTAKWKTIAENAAEIIGSVTMIASAVQMGIEAFKQFNDVMNDTSATAEEKAAATFQFLTQVLTSVAMTVPSVLSGIEAVKLSATAAGSEIGAAGAVASLGWGPFLAVLAAIGLAIAAVVGVIYLISKAQEEATERANAYNNELEATTEAANAASTAVSTLSSSVDDLKNSWENFISLENDLDDLTEGTDEWKEKVQELNLAVLDLVENYPELAQYMTNTNGVLSIDQEGYDAIIQQKQDALLDAQNVQNILNTEKKQLSASTAVEKFVNDYGNYKKESQSDDATRLGIKQYTVELLEGKSYDDIIEILSDYNKKAKTEDKYDTDLYKMMTEDMKLASDDAQDPYVVQQFKSILKTYAENAKATDNETYQLIGYDGKTYTRNYEADKDLGGRAIIQTLGVNDVYKSVTNLKNLTDDNAVNYLKTYTSSTDDSGNKITGTNEYLAQVAQLGSVDDLKDWDLNDEGKIVITQTNGETQELKLDLDALIDSLNALRGVEEARIEQREQDTKIAEIGGFSVDDDGNFTGITEKVGENLKDAGVITYNDYHSTDKNGNRVGNDKKDSYEDWTPIFSDEDGTIQNKMRTVAEEMKRNNKTSEEIKNLTGVVIQKNGKVDIENSSQDTFNRYIQQINEVCTQLNNLNTAIEKVTSANQNYASMLSDSTYLENNTNLSDTEDTTAFNGRVSALAEKDEMYQLISKSVKDSYDKIQEADAEKEGTLYKKEEDGKTTVLTEKDYDRLKEYQKEGFEKTESAVEDATLTYNAAKETLENYQKELAESEAAQLRLEKGVETLRDNFDDWEKTLTDINASETDIINTTDDLTGCIQDIVNLDVSWDDLLNVKGVKQNDLLKWLKSIKKGGEDAEEALYNVEKVAAVAYAQNTQDNAEDSSKYAYTTGADDEVDKQLKQADEKAESEGLITTNINFDEEGTQVNLADCVQGIHDSLDQVEAGVEITADDSPFIRILNEIIKKTGMTTDKVKQLFGELDTISFGPEVTEVETETTAPTVDTDYKASLPNFRYTSTLDLGSSVVDTIKNGGKLTLNGSFESFNLDSTEGEGEISTDSDTKKGHAQLVTGITKGNGSKKKIPATKSSSSGSGSSGGSSKKASKASKQNTASKGTPRKQIKKLKTDNVANKTSKILDKISKQNDKLYGKNQINNLKNLIKYQLKYVDTLNKQYKANAKILKGMKSGFKRHKYKDNDGNTAISYWTTSGTKNTNNGDKTIKGTKYKMKNKIKFNADGSIDEASYEKARMELYNKVESARKAANKSNLSEKESKRRQNKYSRLEEEYEELTSAYSSYNSKLEENEEILESMSEEIDEVRETQETLIDTYKELNEMMDTAQDNFISIANALAQISSEDYGTIWSDITSNLIEATSEAEKYLEKEKRRRSYDGADGTNFTATKLEQSIQNMGDLYSDLYDYYNTKINGKTISQWEQDKTAYETAYNNGGNYTYTDANGKQKTLKGIDQLALEKFLVAYKKAETQANKKGMMMVNETTLNEYISDSYSTLAETVTNMKDAAESLKDSGDSLAEEIISTWDDLSSDLSTISSKLDTLNDIAAIIEGSENYNTQIDLMDQQIDIAKANGEVLQHKLDSVTKLAETYKDLYGENSEQYINYASQQYEIQSGIYNNVSDILSYVQQQMELRFKQSAADILGELGIDSSSWMDMEWENNDSYNDGWYDEYEKSYQIQTLKNSYQNLLDDASSLSTQQKITEQMNQQITYLQEKTNLSEYDVEYAEKQLDILKAQIALEDAQNNKNKMKLRRDASGNYSYVYTADENEVLDKQQELLDAQNEAYELAKERLEDASKNIKTYVTQAGEDLATIWETYSGEEAQKRSAEYLEQLQEYIKKTANNINDANNGLSESTTKLNKTLTECFSNNTLETLANKIKQGTISLSDFGFVFKDEEKYVSTLTNLGEKIDDLIDAFEREAAQVGKDYETNINTSSSGIDTSGSTESSQLSTISSTISNRVKDCDDKLKTINNALTQSSKLLEALVKTMVVKLTDNKGNIKYMSTTLATQQGITDFSGKTSYTVDGTKYTASKVSLADFSEVSENYANKVGTTTNKKAEESVNKSSGNNDDTSSTGGSNNWTADGKLTKADAGKGYVAFKKGTEVYSNAKKLTTKAGKKKETLNNGNGLRWNLYGYNANRPNGKEWKLQSAKNTKRFVYTSASNIKNKALKKYSKYDTGGYTGNWTDSGAGLDSKNGKLAILHQKELVLNAKDTENMLKIVEAERDLMQKSSATTPTFDLSSVLKAMNNDTIEQRVQIDAQFPNAENTNEIKQALLSLADNAYIYANRNIK